MSATFACPHCGATYPVKPVLVGRAVRCTKCKNAFKLRDDGIADKVEMEAPAFPAAASVPAAAAPPAVADTPARPVAPARPATAPQPAERAPEPRPAAPATKPASASPASPPAPPSAPGRQPEKPPAAAPSSSTSGPMQAGESRGARLTKQQEEARRAMAGTLSTAASLALQADAVKREATKDEKKGPKGPKSKDGTVGKIGPVLVVGEGERESKNRKAWLGGTLAIVAVIVLLGWLFSLRSPARRALDAFAAPVEAQYARYPQRLPHMQARAWLSNSRALIDLGSLHIGKTTRFELAAAKPLIAEIAKDQTYLQEYEIWVHNADTAKVTKTWNPKKERKANIDVLNGSEATVVTREDFEAKLLAGGLSADGVAVVMTLLLPSQGAPQGGAQRVRAGECPDAIEVTQFTGHKGIALQDAGNKYAFPVGDYSGTTLRFIGAGWPTEWRVLNVGFNR